MRIDAHQHFWDLDRFSYPWMPSEPSPLRQNYLPPDLKPILAGNRFEGSVVVQATTSLEEARWLLDLAEQYDFIRAVVGWADLTAPDLPRLLDGLQTYPKFRGVRHPVHDEDDDRWLLRKDVLRGLRELERRDLTFDLLLRPRHLALIPALVEHVPKLRMAIDHLAKPPIAGGCMDGWAEDLERIADLPQVYVKMSGLITEADHKNWKAHHLKPFVQHAYRVFGPDRLMFGSDWPVCLQAGAWKEVLAVFTQTLGPLPVETRLRLLGGTAAEFYGIRAIAGSPDEADA
jgi:L-fuconolactonase